MKKSIQQFIVLLCAFFTYTAQAQSEDEKSIRAALQNWVTNYNAENFEKTFEVWSPELIGWYPGSPEITYEMSTKVPSKSAVKSTYKLTINEVLMDGKLAVVRDTWEQTITKEGAVLKVILIKSFEVWKKHDDNKWKIIRWISYEGK